MVVEEMVAPLFKTDRMEYETPRGGITIGGYVARRLHKTILLKPIPELLADDPARALAQFGLYAAAASTSFGPAHYQPEGERVGAIIETTDPDTGARVIVTCEQELRFAYRVEMDGVGTLSGAETITGTTFGLRGLGMPAPTTFEFESATGSYRAKAVGLMTSELVPGFGTWKIRGHGTLDLTDNVGNRGKLSLERSGRIAVSIIASDGRGLDLKERMVWK
jgi:hypothetical protein